MAGPSGAPPASRFEHTPLVDHHVHSVVRDVSDRAAFERLITEGGAPPARGRTHFDSFLGAALLRHCGPVLGLGAEATPEEYLARRFELGGAEANRRLLRAARIDTLLVDHGFRSDDLVVPSELGDLASTPVRDIVRLEHLAEQVASAGVSAEKFADAFSERLAAELSGPDAAVGTKSVLAYRYGLDVDPAEPSPGQVREAVGEWLSEAAGAGTLRVSHPTVLRHLVWSGLRAGKPLQFHVGYGDTDLELHRANPSLLTRLIRLADPLGTPIMLLHCYPYHREAAYLSAVYPNVYFDVGFVITYAGHRATAVLAEALEATYFHKMLYSSDAFGLAELHLLGAEQFRAGLGAVLDPLVTLERRSEAELSRVAALMGAGNARHLYGLEGAAGAGGGGGGATTGAG